MFSIAIDGPAGAGKSTIAKKVAKKLDITYIDTGAMYRAMGLYCMNNNILLDHRSTIIECLNHIDITIRHIDDEQHVFLDGMDVNHLIRSHEVSESASRVSSIKEVREKLVELQRGIASRESVIMDGRDIGTHVLVHATLKIFLVAGVEVRALRRYTESLEKGHDTSLETIKQDIIDRDYRDMNREASPLERASDAVLVDTTKMTI
ncbi:MAG: (d)CMP kinase, partial [Vallitaleaceae bacterium]|nr:(d)CMP kinase [Vallitaleaceae bacterium]